MQVYTLVNKCIEKNLKVHIKYKTFYTRSKLKERYILEKSQEDILPKCTHV